MTWKIWGITDNFKEVDAKVWSKYKKSNGVFQKYFFIRRVLVRGKTHPQILMSMMGEYAMFLILLNWLGVVPTIPIQIIGLCSLIAGLLVLGFLDILFEVARKESSWNSRFSPEQQQLYRQTSEIHKILARGEINELAGKNQSQQASKKDLRRTNTHVRKKE